MGKFGAMPQWTPHDLRRTASTQMANHGVYPHITEKILNHTMKGVLAVYNLGEYLPERKSALELWSDLIEEWVSETQQTETPEPMQERLCRQP